ncbi:hypothetical protein [Paraburkholderia bryophila]|uniref:hypothetical protein n=1 Tax=Paraburkholderia bryophila TaxID=420952 RepID=UPI001FC873E5|nr:hypothetical protein [Paraburkholderia bryophila]
MPIHEVFAFNAVSAPAVTPNDAAANPVAQASTANLLLNVKRGKVFPPVNAAPRADLRPRGNQKKQNKNMRTGRAIQHASRHTSRQTSKEQDDATVRRERVARAAHAPSLASRSARLTLRGKNRATKIENNSKIFDASSILKEIDLKID